MYWGAFSTALTNLYAPLRFFEIHATWAKSMHNATSDSNLERKESPQPKEPILTGLLKLLTLASPLARHLIPLILHSYPPGACPLLNTHSLRNPLPSLSIATSLVMPWWAEEREKERNDTKFWLQLRLAKQRVSREPQLGFIWLFVCEVFLSFNTGLCGPLEAWKGTTPKRVRLLRQEMYSGLLRHLPLCSLAFRIIVVAVELSRNWKCGDEEELFSCICSKLLVCQEDCCHKQVAKWRTSHLWALSDSRAK